MQFTYEGKDYSPKITRAGIRAAEAQGLTTQTLTNQPMSALYLLFFAAMFSQYKTAPNKADSMLDDLLDSGELVVESLFEALGTEYGELFGSGGSETS